MNLKLEDSGWKLIEGHTEEFRYEMRFREFSENPITEQYGQRINIIWAVSDSLDDGFPSEAELVKLQAFEDRLISAVESDEFSILSLVMTGNRKREFVLYTPDPQAFVQRLSEMPHDEVEYPIQVHAKKDPTWLCYYKELEKLENT